MNDREPAWEAGRMPGLLGLRLLIAAVMGMVPIVVGLGLLSVATTIAPPPDGHGPDPNTVEKHDAKQDAQPKPVLVPWPPETFAFAGKKAGEEWSANGLSMNFCWCPAGTFMMGSPKDEKDREFNRTSEEQLEATLTNGFWMGKYELTQGQWEWLMGTNLLQQADNAWGQLNWETQNEGYYDAWWDMNRLKWRPQRRGRWQGEPYFGEGPTYPMYFVNHLEATDFCLQLTEQERKAGRLPPGWEYRLPTEAQWEYACRAGTKTATAFGDSLSSRQADFDGSLPYNGAAPGPKLGRTQPVGSYPPNGWGLCDMHGNVWEWCRDWDGWRKGGTDPEIKFGDLNRVIRGGSWRDQGLLCRSAIRFSSKWSTQNYETGFRVAIVQLDPQPKQAPELLNPTPLPPGILTNSLGMKLAPIPAGKFLMGSPVNETGRPWLGREEIDYEEQHAMTIREPFYLGVYLVTQEQYEQIMGKAAGYQPSYFSSEGGGKDKVKEFKDTRQFPRENVSREDIQEFCRRLSELPEERKWGRRYRLPTEAEWEYACRAGTSTPYYFGTTISALQANVDNKLGRTTPVGFYNNPNKFGLCDMHGNLSQWCDDLYAPYQKDMRDPNRIYLYAMRGGFWGDPGIACRSASRAENYNASMNCGFRVALSVGAGTR